MAEASSDAPQENEETKKKSVLEEKSKEDLIKIVKKQLTLLQKAKSKSDELDKKLNYNKALEEKENEIKNLRDKVKCWDAERNSFVTSINEKDEQLQCLSMQMNTIKETCLCLQEELTKLQLSNKELKDEISVLHEARDAALESLKTKSFSLDSKTKECTDLIDEINELNKKYSICIEENCLLTSKIVNLETEIKNIQTENLNPSEAENVNINDFSILISDNQNLQKEIKQLKEEYNNLKKTSFENHNENVMNLEKDLQSQEIANVKKEIFELQQHLIEVESMNSKLKTIQNSLEVDNHDLSEKVQSLESDKINYNLKFESLENDKLELKEEVKRLVSCLEGLTDSKTGYEDALLHGATTECLSLTPVVENKSKLEIKEALSYQLNQETFSNVDAKKPTEKAEHNFEFDSEDLGSGIEFGFLSGGNVDELYENANVESSNKIVSSHFENHPVTESFVVNENLEICEKQELFKLNQTELVCLFEKLKLEKDNLDDEVKMLKTRVDEYANLLQETLSDKESLKLALENYQKEQQVPSVDLKATSNLIMTATNTEFDLVEKALHEEKLAATEAHFHKLVCDLESQISNLNKKIELSETEMSECLEKNVTLQTEVEVLNVRIHDLFKTIQDLEIQNENVTTHSKMLEEENFELNEKITKNDEELDKFNLRLEQLIVSIELNKQEALFTNKTKKQLYENMNIIETRVHELILCNNENFQKIKKFEENLNDLAIQKQTVYEELFQMKELNLFLEDEARELRNEVEQMKVNQNSFDDQRNDNYFNEHPLKNSNELYSIEEIDDDPSVEPTSSKADILPVNDYNVDYEGTGFDKLNDKTDSTKIDVSVQVNINMHKEEDSLPSNEMECEDENIIIDSQKEIINEYQIHIEQLNNENSKLKCSLNDKSILVERIHCEMDALLEKIETINQELNEKNDDLKCSQEEISYLQKQIHKLDDIFNSRNNVLKYINNILNELHNEKDNLKSDISSLNAFSNEALAIVKNYLSTTIDEYKLNNKNLTEKCCHMDKIMHFTKQEVDRLDKDFNLWSNTLEHLIDADDKTKRFSVSNDDINVLKQTFQNEPLKDIFENKCNNDCCSIFNNIKKMEVSKQKLLNFLHNNFFNLYQSMLNELDDYKKCIIPNLKSTIQNLDDKLNKYVDKKDSKEDILEQKSEKNEEESSESILKKQLAETEIKMAKCKQIALKLKKELMESKKQTEEAKLEKDKYITKLNEAHEELEKVSSEQLQYAQNYQSLQNEYDKTQDELEIQKENTKKLEIDLSATLMELNSLKEKVADMNSQLLKTNQNLEASVLAQQDKEKLLVDLESKLIVLECKKQEKSHKIEELQAELNEKMEKISYLTDENNNLKEQLNCSQKVENKKNLLDLEMADYERSISELNNKIQKKDDEINEIKMKLNCEIEKNLGLLEEIKSTEKLNKTEQKRADDLKEILDKTKSELSATKERESELLTKVTHLQMQLEIVTQQEENCKLQLSETSAEIQHLKEMIKTSSENHQRIVHSLDSKVSTQKQEILCAHKEVENIKQEFENYKIRVHSVLKQQKSTIPTFASVDEDVKEKLEAMVEKLKMQVKQLSEKLAAVSMEYEALQEEHDNLLQRYNKAIEEREKKDSEWHLKLEQINAEKNKLRTAQEELSSQHLFQNEMLVSTYKKQIKIMSDEHKRTVNELQKQLESADLEISRLQRDQQKAHGLPVTPIAQDNPTFDILSQERQEGEGSESIDGSDTPIRHLSLTTIPTSGFLPFEKLLQSPHEELNTSANYFNNHDSDKLLADLNASNKKIDHLAEVLNESESTNLRLSEQVRVLKEEVRRLERNKEREQHAENLEYLKNVFIKFSTLGACSEKAMLIPVLTTMLKLSPVEQQQLKDIAGEIDANDSSGSGWGSYLHRWSGLA
ncbi:GRIP and coiled-coil domain-containing protein 2 [Caerostris darwini]|uniref:GRIP and coiled-coil domain-containing protein 2 n=1 Tax=Caerostris darwini TaxID=1538125 RepID=A0AAV4WSR4_9ARAC|nr:GRIP and coiled-coil domain-containing protein 2 [Caerostris darwini]